MINFSSIFLKQKQLAVVMEIMNIWSRCRIKHHKTVQFGFKLNFSSFSTRDNKHTATDHISYYYKQVRVVLTPTVKSDLIFPACSVKNLFFALVFSSMFLLADSAP